MQRSLIAPKLFYFCWFAALGAFSPFVSLYYRGVAGLDEGQIGLLVSLTGVLQIVAAPLWGLLADALRLRQVLLPLVVAGTLPAVFLIGQTTAFGLLALCVALLALFSAPVGALADSATLEALGERRDRYGAQRVWGAVGWMLSTWLFGWLVQQSGFGISFASYIGLGALTALVAVFLPRATLKQVDLRVAAVSMLRDRRWAFFLGSVMLIGCCSATVHGFLSLYLEDLGADRQQIGFAVAIGSLTELPVMALAPMVLRRWGSRPLLLCGGLLYALRTLIYAVAPTPGWALAAQLLHGPCFAALWMGGVDEAQRMAPEGLESTAQSLFGTMFFGISTALASAIGGQIYRDFGYGALFGFGAIAALLGTLGLFLGMRNPATSILATERQ